MRKITDKLVLAAVVGFIALGVTQTTLAWTVSFSSKKRRREERRRRQEQREWT